MCCPIDILTIRKSIFPVESEILNEAEEEELKKKFLSRRETRKSIFQVEQQIQNTCFKCQN